VTFGELRLGSSEQPEEAVDILLVGLFQPVGALPQPAVGLKPLGQHVEAEGLDKVVERPEFHG
jgi:hypothetical protein